jgi:hypothetical protein
MNDNREIFEVPGDKPQTIQLVFVAFPLSTQYYGEGTRSG